MRDTHVSDTPRTDAAIKTNVGAIYVEADFARQLERELSHVQRTLAYAIDHCLIKEEALRSAQEACAKS